MSDSAVEAIKDELRELVSQLFRAENGLGRADTNGSDDYIAKANRTAEGIRAVADGILAPDYIPITRGSGKVDDNREHTLQQIVDGSPDFRRHVARADIEVHLFRDGTVAIVRSRLPATDSRGQAPTEASFRNMQVFLRRNDRWECIAWQVTRVQPPPT